MKRRILAAAAAACAILALGAPVSAHEQHSLGGGPWLSEVTEITVVGLYAVTGGDSVLNVTVEPGQAAEIPGYENEPYLRIAADGAWEANVVSPTWWVNQDPDTIIELGEGISADAAPQWEPASTGRLVAFHDHRIHWMGAELPNRDLTVPFKLNDWSVPVAVDGVAGAIEGELWFDVELIAGAAARYGAAPGADAVIDDAVAASANSDSGDNGSNIAMIAGVVLIVAALGGGVVMLVAKRDRTGS